MELSFLFSGACMSLCRSTQLKKAFEMIASTALRMNVKGLGPVGEIANAMDTG